MKNLLHGIAKHGNNFRKWDKLAWTLCSKITLINNDSWDPKVQPILSHLLNKINSVYLHFRVIKQLRKCLIYAHLKYNFNLAQLDESSVQKKYYWINFGAGSGSISEDAFAGSANATYQFGNNLLTLRAAGTAELFRKSMSEPIPSLSTGTNQ